MSGETGRLRRFWISAQHFLSFFLLMCLIITCCMTLFLSTMERVMGLEFSQENISLAAKLTFANVIFLSLICTIIDSIRRKLMVGRPVRRIIEAAEKIMEGDLTARIQPVRSVDPEDGFNIVIGYFNQMAQELSSMETLRTDFIANVSHELKTPLAVMQNYGTMLQQPGLSEEQRLEYAKAITEAARRLADLITNILRLSKLENQQIFPAAEPYDLGEQLCQCLLSFESAWERKNLNIETDLAENVTVCADGEMLTLVWNNLFSNAIKFTEPGGTVSLRLAAEDEWAVVQVSDTGCGIPPEVGAHIFEKFYQGDTSHATQGNGLGLALVKRVVDITGGQITVESQVGKGSTFTVQLGRVI